MSGRKPKLSAEQVSMVQQWWKWRKISNKAMRRQLGVGTRTLLNAIRREGAYRSRAR